MREHRLLLTFAALVATVLLVGALRDGWPYGYFTLLRWVVCAAGVVVAWIAYSWGRSWAVAVFALVAILFNPLAPVYLSRETWQPIDIAVAALFLVAIPLVKPQRE